MIQIHSLEHFNYFLNTRLFSLKTHSLQKQWIYPYLKEFNSIHHQNKSPNSYKTFHQLSLEILEDVKKLHITASLSQLQRFIYFHYRLIIIISLSSITWLKFICIQKKKSIQCIINTSQPTHSRCLINYLWEF